MVLSSHGALGRGSRPSERVQDHVGDGTENDPLRLNYIGNSYLTHFLCCLMPISLYNRTPEAFFQMLEIQAQEYVELFENGLVVRGVKFYFCCLGCKGDAPYLSKSGKFLRAFTRRPTRASSKTPAQGVCHLCLAGKEDWEREVCFEEFGEEPAWLQTVGLLKPYDVRDPSPLLQIPFDHVEGAEQFFRFDIFHNWHSGVGKYFISSAVCVCMELIQMSVQNAFTFISDDFKAYCKKHRESPYHKTLTASLFGMETGLGKCPDASWSKGDFTRLIHQWFADYCQRHVVGKTDDGLYLKCVAKLNTIDNFFFNVFFLC